MFGSNPLLVGSKKTTPEFGRVTLVSLTARERAETADGGPMLLLLKLAALLDGNLDMRNGWTLPNVPSGPFQIRLTLPKPGRAVLVGSKLRPYQNQVGLFW